MDNEPMNEDLQPVAHHNGTWIFIAIVLFVVGLGIGFGVSNALKKDPTPVNTNTVVNTPPPTVVEEVPVVVVPIEEQKPGEYVEPSVKADGTVNWYAKSIELPDQNFFSKTGEYSPSFQYSEYGEVMLGKYKGGKLVYASEEGLGVGYPHRFVVLNGKKYWLKQHSASLDLGRIDGATHKGDFTIDSTTVLEDLVVPKSVKLPNGATLTLQENMWMLLMPTTESGFKKTYSVGKYERIYESFDGYEMGGHYIVTPDHIAESYKYTVPFDESDITFNDGSKVGPYISYAASGCGTTVVAMADETVKASDLVAMGKVRGTNYVLYALASSEHPYLKSIYEQHVHDKQAISYERFTASKPMFFWKSEFGTYVRFLNSNFVAGAECGKPVIYLYPEKTTNVNVQVAPKKGFSITEPAYGQGGWNVTASPDGTLIDRSTGKTWPYLFWEGRGTTDGTGNTKGFVVSRAEVKNLLEQKLKLAGLNEQERADFIEFWHPRMQTAPYYFVTFYGNQLMNQIAPLKVTPQPQSVIRILMDYKPLEQPVRVEPLEITTPKRTGFTVVEWGGVLH